MNQTADSVSFIIPCYRNLRTIGFTLRSLLSQQNCPDFEIFVVDSSEEAVSDWMKTHFPRVRVIRPTRRLWAGAARNFGGARTGADLLAFVDADAVLQPDWLAILGRRMAESEETVAVGGYIGNANPGTLASRILHWAEFSEFLPGAPSGFRPFLSSSNLLLRRSTFVETGGFPEHLPASEDRLFCYRLESREPGRVFWEGSTGILHYHRSRWAELRAHLRHLGYWGGRVRKETQGLPGAGLGRIPSAALLLPFYRTPAVIARVCRARRRDTAAAVALAPLIFLALASWARGFREGLKGM